MKKFCFLVFLVLLPSIFCCEHSKEELYHCMTENDPNNDNEISKNEIKHLFDIKLYWFEKLIYPIDWIISQFEEDCGLPLTKNNFNKVTCFKKCIYRDALFNKLC